MPDPAAILAPIRQALNLAHSTYGVPRLILETAIHQAEEIARADSSPDGHCQACGKRSASATCRACVKAVEDKPWRFGVGTLLTVLVVGGGIGWVVGLAVGHGI